jgi:drug/metabolite transporter (DMT)-like permease
MVSVASVLGSLYPVATLFWARMLLGERLRHVQAIGVVMTLVGVVAIAL